MTNLIFNDINNSKGFIDLHISRQNPSIETTTSGYNENLSKRFPINF